jgi:hypothetical protein
MRNAPPPREVFYSVRTDKTLPLASVDRSLALSALKAPDVSHLDAAGAAARRLEIQKRLGQTRGDASKAMEREALKVEEQALGAWIRELKEQAKLENARRAYTGIHSPLYEAMVERLPAELVKELEAAAYKRLEERERRAAERKGAVKDAASKDGGGKDGGVRRQDAR